MNAPFPILAVDARTRAHLDARSWEPRTWWQTRTATLFFVLIACLPLLYPAIPPLVDLPGHMGRYRVELDLAHSPELQRHFTYTWSVIGNLGVDLLIIPFSKLFGLELATKLIVACIPPLTVAGFLAVAREVHGRVPATALFALPLAYNHAFEFGFVNFALSMALCFLAFAYWLRLGRQGRLTLRTVLFAPICLVLFLVHAFGWGSFCILAFSNELTRHWKGREQWKSTLLTAIRHCLVLGLPLLPLLIWRGHGTGIPLQGWFNVPLKMTWLAGIFRDQWRFVDLVFAMILFHVLIQARSRPRMRFAPSLLVASAFMTAAFVLFPWKVMDSAYADMRLAPYLIATALLAISWKDRGGEDERRWAWHGSIFLAAVLIARTASFGIAAHDQQRQLAVLDKIPIGSRVLALAGRQCGDGWALPRNTHYASMVTARRDGFANDQWVTPGMNLLGVRTANLGRFDSDPSQIVVPVECASEEFWSVEHSLAAMPEGWFEYLWLIDAKPKDARLLMKFRKVWQSGDSALYKLR
jgi:hypothetical protein